MRYGHFDNENREYVIDRVDVPVSWTNYLGVKDLCTVISHNAGGYSFYKNSEHGRVTRFRPNGVPLDRPGHYVYLRDNDSGDYWSISWQPVGKDLAKAKVRDPAWAFVFEVLLRIPGSEGRADVVHPGRGRCRTVGCEDSQYGRRSHATSACFGYCEFSFHHIEIDNQNLQMSLYASGTSYGDGVIEYDFYLRAVDVPLLRRRASIQTATTRCAMRSWAAIGRRRIRLQWSRASVTAARNWAGIIAARCRSG